MNNIVILSLLILVLALAITGIALGGFSYFSTSSLKSDTDTNYLKKTDGDLKYAVKSDLDDFYEKTESDTKFATKTDLSLYPTTLQLTSNYYTKTESNNNFATISNTYTKTESDNKFATISNTYTKTESDNNFATKTQVNEKLDKSAVKTARTSSSLDTYACSYIDNEFDKISNSTADALWSKYGLVENGIVENLNEDVFAGRVATSLNITSFANRLDTTSFGGKVANILDTTSFGGKVGSSLDSTSFANKVGSSLDSTSFATKIGDLNYVNRSELGSYYTKVESDGKFATKTDTYTKTENDNLFPKKTELTTALALKADKTEIPSVSRLVNYGSTINQISILNVQGLSNYNSGIELRDTDSNGTLYDGNIYVPFYGIQDFKYVSTINFKVGNRLTQFLPSTYGHMFFRTMGSVNVWSDMNRIVDSSDINVSVPSTNSTNYHAFSGPQNFYMNTRDAKYSLERPPSEVSTSYATSYRFIMFKLKNPIVIDSFDLVERTNNFSLKIIKASSQNITVDSEQVLDTFTTEEIIYTFDITTVRDSGTNSNTSSVKYTLTTPVRLEKDTLYGIGVVNGWNVQTSENRNLRRLLQDLPMLSYLYPSNHTEKAVAFNPLNSSDKDLIVKTVSTSVRSQDLTKADIPAFGMSFRVEYFTSIHRGGDLTHTEYLESNTTRYVNPLTINRSTNATGSGFGSISVENLPNVDLKASLVQTCKHSNNVSQTFTTTNNNTYIRTWNPSSSVSNWTGIKKILDSGDINKHIPSIDKLGYHLLNNDTEFDINLFPYVNIDTAVSAGRVNKSYNSISFVPSVSFSLKSIKFKPASSEEARIYIWECLEMAEIKHLPTSLTSTSRGSILKPDGLISEVKITTNTEYKYDKDIENTYTHVFDEPVILYNDRRYAIVYSNIYISNTKTSNIVNFINQNAILSDFFPNQNNRRAMLTNKTGEGFPEHLHGYHSTSDPNGLPLMSFQVDVNMKHNLLNLSSTHDKDFRIDRSYSMSYESRAANEEGRFFGILIKFKHAVEISAIYYKPDGGGTTTIRIHEADILTERNSKNVYIKKELVRTFKNDNQQDVAFDSNTFYYQHITPVVLYPNKFYVLSANYIMTGNDPINITKIRNEHNLIDYFYPSYPNSEALEFNTSDTSEMKKSNTQKKIPHLGFRYKISMSSSMEKIYNYITNKYYYGIFEYKNDTSINIYHILGNLKINGGVGIPTVSGGTFEINYEKSVTVLKDAVGYGCVMTHAGVSVYVDDVNENSLTFQFFNANATAITPSSTFKFWLRIENP